MHAHMQARADIHTVTVLTCNHTHALTHMHIDTASHTLVHIHLQHANESAAYFIVGEVEVRVGHALSESGEHVTVRAPELGFESALLALPHAPASSRLEEEVDEQGLLGGELVDCLLLLLVKREVWSNWREEGREGRREGGMEGGMNRGKEGSREGGRG